VPAKSGCQPSAIVGRSRRSCFAVIAEMRGRAIANTLPKATSQSSKAGQACSSAATSASVSSTVACTNAKKSATRKKRRHHTARGPLTSLHTVLVERHHSRRSPTRRERFAKTTYRAARGHAVRHYHAVTNASRSATPAVVEAASRPSSSNADVAALRQTHSATRVRMKRPSACAFVE
jgi:hypothetical protein